MKIDLIDAKEFIRVNKLKEITSPALYERGGVPNANGLISNEIFGVNVQSRKTTFAYISLNGHFFSPVVYKQFKRMFRNIEKIVDGSRTFSITEKGELVPDEKGQTGIDFLYKNWEKIKWNRTTGMRNERIDLLTKTPKNQIFVEYWIVIPAFYRDISSSGAGGKTIPLNSMYSKLIRYSSLLKGNSLFAFSFNSTKAAIQNTLVEIYDYFRDKMKGKGGLLRRYLLGKSVDFCVRTVISDPIYHGDRVGDDMVDFDHAAIPVSHICVELHPFMIHWLKNFFQQAVVNEQYNKEVLGASVTTVKLKDPEIHFNDTFLKNQLDRYYYDTSSRFDIVTVPLEKPLNGKKELPLVFRGRIVDQPGRESTLVDRPLTWTDVMYMAACDVSEGKHALITRYPLLHQHGIIVTKYNVRSTNETTPMEVNGKIYRWYPVIDLKKDKKQVSVSFTDSVSFSNSFLKGNGGDFTECRSLPFAVMRLNKFCERLTSGVYRKVC